MVSGTNRLLGETSEKLKYLSHAIQNYPKADLSLMREVKEIEALLRECSITLYGDGVVSALEQETLPSLNGRLGITEYQLSSNTTGVTKTQKENLALVKEEYAPMREKLNSAMTRVKTLKEKLSLIPIPFTKDGDIDWKED